MHPVGQSAQMRQKGGTVTRATYGGNTGDSEGSVIGKVGSCSLKYGSLVDPANEGGIRVCGFLVVHPKMVG